MCRLPRSASLALAGAAAFFIACSGSDLTLPDQGLAAKIVIVRGDPQTAAAGSQLPDSLIVRVTDSKDRPIVGQLVGFAASAGSVVPATAATNTDGRTGAIWVLGPVAGPQTATATANGNGAPPGLVVTFHATATSSTPARLDKTAGDGQQATAGSPVATPPAVKVTDAGGNPVAGVAVAFAVSAGGGSANPTTPVTTDAAGVAAVTAWTLGPVAGANSLTATIPGTGIIGNPATFTATGTVGSAGKLAIAQQPSAAAQSGVPFPQQPQVQAQDAHGNPVKTAGLAVTATLASGVGAGLSGQLTVATDANGVAAFTNLALTGPQGTYTLAFSSLTLSGVTSAAIALGAGAAAQLVIAQQPAAAAQSGISLNPQPAVQLQDAEGNPAPQAGVAVTASLNGAGAALSGTKTRPTDATGRAAFTDLVITGSTGQYSLSFTSVAPAFAVGPSITIGLGAGSPARLIAVTPPSASVANGLVFPQQPVLQVVDGAGNPAGAAGITVRVAITAGGGTLGGTATAVTNASGVASFAGLSITGTAGVRQLTFSSTSPPLTSATASVTVTAGSATQIAASSATTQSATAGAAVSAPPAVVVRDASANPVPGVAVTFAVTAGGGAINPATPVTTNASGIAALTKWTLGPTPGANQVTAAATGLLGSPVVFNATGVAALAITTASPLPAGEVTVAYTTTLTASGGTAPYTWAVTSGTLPAGLALAKNTGAITGKPTSAGTPPACTITVTDAAKTSVTKAFTMTIVPAVLVTTASLPSGTVGVAYSQTLAVSGGQQPYTWSVSAGSLPAGLAINAATGGIAGTPTAAGSFNFTVKVTDVLGGTSTKAYKVAIASAPTVTTTSLPNAEVGAAYTAPLAGTGGTPPYTWSLAGGSSPLPSGLNLASTGVISGTPASPGTFTFTVQLTDAGSATATKALQIVVRAAVGITTLSLPNGAVGVAYSQTLAASGGQPPYTWSVSAGSLPGGLTLAPSTGAITGTPNASGGPFPFTINVGDALGGTDSKAYSITIALASTTTSVSSNHPSAIFGQSVTFKATVSDGASTPTGSVSFYDGGGSCPGSTALATNVALDGSGQASTPSITSLSVGAHTIRACYTPAGSFSASNNTVGQTVSKASTTATIGTVTPSTTVVGQSYSVSVSVTVNLPGAGTPTGNVNVSDGTGGSCSFALPLTSCSLASTTAGGKTLVATYVGDGDFNGDVSPGVAHTVNPAATQTAVGSDVNPSTAGQTVTFTATVTPTAPGSGTPSGNVDFMSGTDCATGTDLSGLVALSSGQAVFQTNALPGGGTTTTVWACYAGTANFQTSSGSVDQLVN